MSAVTHPVEIVYPFLIVCVSVCALCVATVMWADWRRENLLRKVLIAMIDSDRAYAAVGPAPDSTWKSDEDDCSGDEK